MSTIITQGYGNFQRIILQGYGMAIVVPARLIDEKVKWKPRIIRVSERNRIPLSQLGIIVKYDFRTKIYSLSLVKMEKIRVLLIELGIVVSKEVQVILDKLALWKKESYEISLKNLKTMGEDEGANIYIINGLRLIENLSVIVRTASLNYLARSLVELDVAPPDIYKAKVKEVAKRMKKYTKLLDLLDKLGE